MPFCERLSALDASFLEIETESSHMHVSATLLFEAAPVTLAHGGLDMDRIRAAIEAGLDAAPRYRQRLAYTPVSGHPVWIDDAHFNPTYHIRHTSLPRPGDERQLKRLSGRITSQQLDRGKPLWEIWVVEGVEGGRFALITKAHHCMIDGISGVDVLAGMLRPQPMESVGVPRAWQPRPAPSAAWLAAAELKQRAVLPLALVRGARRALAQPAAALTSVRDALRGVGEVLGSGLAPASETPLNLPIGPHRRFDWVRFDLDDVKEVKRRLGGTVNDVVLATVAGAVGRFLRGRGFDPTSLDFRAMIPVNLRADEQRGMLGNRVASMLAELPVGELDPHERLRRVIEMTARLKRSQQVHGAELLEELGDFTGTTLITQLVRLAVRARSYNIVVTNVPGPQVPVFLLEAPLLEIYPMVPLYANQGVGIALFSYNGGLFWGLNADWDALPDLHDLVGALIAELDALRKSASQGAVPLAAPAAAGRRRRAKPPSRSAS